MTATSTAISRAHNHCNSNSNSNSHDSICGNTSTTRRNTSSSSHTPQHFKYHIIENPIKNTRKKITPDLIAQYFSYPQPEAARRLGISVSTLKRLFYQFHPKKRWPYSDNKRAQKVREAMRILNGGPMLSTVSSSSSSLSNQASIVMAPGVTTHSTRASLDGEYDDDDDDAVDDDGEERAQAYLKSRARKSSIDYIVNQQDVCSDPKHLDLYTLNTLSVAFNNRHPYNSFHCS